MLLRKCRQEPSVSKISERSHIESVGLNDSVVSPRGVEIFDAKIRPGAQIRVLRVMIKVLMDRGRKLPIHAGLVKDVSQAVIFLDEWDYSQLSVSIMLHTLTSQKAPTHSISCFYGLEPRRRVSFVVEHALQPSSLFLQ